MTEALGEVRLLVVGIGCRWGGRTGARELASALFETRQLVAEQGADDPTGVGPLCDVVVAAAADARCSLKDRVLVLLVAPPENSSDTAATLLDGLAARGMGNARCDVTESLGHGLQRAAEVLKDPAWSAVVLCQARMGSSAERRPFTMAFDAGWQGYPKLDGAAAVALRADDEADDAGDVPRRSWARIRGVALEEAETQGARSFEGAVRRVLAAAELHADDVGLCVLSAAPAAVVAESTGIARIFARASAATGAPICALSSPRATLGEAGGVDLAGLIVTSLCLSERFLPGVPGWSGPRARALREGHACYVATESRPWLRTPGTERRALVSLALDDGRFGAVLLEAPSSSPSKDPSARATLRRKPARIFPLLGRSRGELVEDLGLLRTESRGADLEVLSASRLVRLAEGPPLVYAIVARDAVELERELDRAATGLAQATPDAAWRTPSGSYFAMRPLGREGKIAFVYPGMGSAAPGLGASLLQQFPALLTRFERLEGISPAVALGADLLYPRRMEALDADARRQLQRELQLNSGMIARSSMTLSWLLTSLLRDDLELEPSLALGYSVGEASMFAALGVWPEPGKLQQRLDASPLFSERLGGPMASVRAAWGLPPDANLSWASFIVKTSAEATQLVLEGESRVWLLAINGPNEVMIGGDEAACARVLAALEAPSIPVPFRLAIHSAVAVPQEDALADLHTIPVVAQPGIEFYSSASCAPVGQDSSTIGRDIARAYVGSVDFPSLVRRSYADGARLFIEVGARANCSQWIGQTLAASPHAAIPLCPEAVDEQLGIVRALAALISHRAPLDAHAIAALGSARAPDEHQPATVRSAEVEVAEEIAVPRGREHTDGAAGAAGPVHGALMRFLRSSHAEAHGVSADAARHIHILAQVRLEIADVLQIRSPEAIDPTTPFQELGLDSLMVLELGSRLSNVTGTLLTAAFLYEANDPAGLARALARLSAPDASQVLSSPSPTGDVVRRASSEVRSAQAELIVRLGASTTVDERRGLLRAPLQALFEKGLGIAPLPANDDLVRMGLDDVLAAELCFAIRRIVGLRFLPRELLACRSFDEVVTKIATLCEPYRAPADFPSLAEIDRRVESPYDVVGNADDVEVSQRPHVFVLTPPRSGSTLLRVMLAGHSGLFSPQELHLAWFASMKSHHAALNGTAINLGVVNTIAEVTSKTGALNLYQDWVRDAASTHYVDAFIADRIGDRVLVDKSPLFFPPYETLASLSRRYPNARFIHLVRDPVSCIGSYVRERFQAVFEATNALDPYDAAEWCWTRVNEGILRFEEEAPAGRFFRLHFEDLSTRPEQVMRRLCPFLGVPFEAAVLDPYSGHRMVAGGFQVGDPNFNTHRAVVADKADAWRDVQLPRALHRETVELAERLGYPVHELRAGDGAAGQGARRSPSSKTAMGGMDLEQDAVLPASIVPLGDAPRPDLSSVLLTGATGFLGAFLLDELLRQTDFEVRCLVRASGQEEGKQRVRDNLRSYGVWRDEYEPRIVAVPGTLDAPNLGLSEEDHRTLAREIAAIYHCGARISWLLPYRSVRETNVLGLQRMLHLSAVGGAVPVHHLSSLGAIFVRPFEETQMVRDVTEASGLGTESIVELSLGYLESKWVGARLVREARSRGLAVTSYFPGLLAGHSQTGIDSLAESQFVHALFKGSAELGCFPDAVGWRFLPIDIVARNIVATSLLPEARDLDLYLDSATFLRPEDAVEELRLQGHTLELVPFSFWRQKVLKLAATNQTQNALFAFTDLVQSFTPLRFKGQGHQTDWYLQNRGVPARVEAAIRNETSLQRPWLQRLLGYYAESGAMPPAQRVR